MTLHQLLTWHLTHTSHAALARQLGVTPARLESVRSGRRHLRLGTVALWATRLNAPVNAVLVDELNAQLARQGLALRVRGL